VLLRTTHRLAAAVLIRSRHPPVEQGFIRSGVGRYATSLRASPRSWKTGNGRQGVGERHRLAHALCRLELVTAEGPLDGGRIRVLASSRRDDSIERSERIVWTSSCTICALSG
jgi:hypothetical protein